MNYELLSFHIWLIKKLIYISANGTCGHIHKKKKNLPIYKYIYINYSVKMHV